jgi:hypothetical protein
LLVDRSDTVKNIPLSQAYPLRWRGVAFGPMEVNVPEGVYPDHVGPVAVTWVRTIISLVGARGPEGVRRYLFNTNYDLEALGDSIDRAKAEYDRFLATHDLAAEGITDVIQLAWIKDIPTLGRFLNDGDTEFALTYTTPSYLGGLALDGSIEHSLTTLRSTDPARAPSDEGVARSEFMRLARMGRDHVGKPIDTARPTNRPTTEAI